MFVFKCDVFKLPGVDLSSGFSRSKTVQVMLLPLASPVNIMEVKKLARFGTGE